MSFRWTDKGPSSQSYAFSNSHVWMWELDHVRAAKNWHFWTVVMEKILKSPLDCKEIKPVRPKGNQSWMFTETTDGETPILWPPDEKNWLIGKDSDSGKDWRQEEKETTEDEIVEWHHWLDGHEFEQALGVGDREAWRAAAHGVAKNQIWLRDWSELNWTHWQKIFANDVTDKVLVLKIKK